MTMAERPAKLNSVCGMDVQVVQRFNSHQFCVLICCNTAAFVGSRMKTKRVLKSFSCVLYSVAFSGWLMASIGKLMS